ncbi:MAG TPA: glycosyltransferase [Paludibacteraceae bacterium]|jgi:glycosyltransferase involved in cell wall biosynthesis|nr:glycosyltransferase [Paludibacteraceae bacterium]
MNNTSMLKPEYIFETSWEVCNMVGGIYTVLSTRAATLKEVYRDKLIFIGPDIWMQKNNPLFVEDSTLFPKWKDFVQQRYQLSIRIGRWQIHGNPIAVLVDFMPLMIKKNEIYGHVWLQTGVNSLPAYGDYHESSMFGYAAGMVIESFYRLFDLSVQNDVMAHFHEWQTSFGIFFLKEHLPEVATIFTTHATTVGRSIASNHKPLYDYLQEYNGDQMAAELNVVSKHSAEKTAAHISDCFTTVSDITAIECKQLLEIKPAVVTPNGFEDDFVPKADDFIQKRQEARACLSKIAETLLGYPLQENALFVGTAGRYEYKNKGIDVFIESMRRLIECPHLNREVVVFIMVPAHVMGPRTDLLTALNHPNIKLHSWNLFTTHELYDYQNDNIMSAIRWFHFTNQSSQKVKMIFVPSYLNGFDGIFNKKYYDLLIGLDVTIFPSYYEPWGYTPLESIAFSVPTITSDLSGFGRWVASQPQDITEGVGVVHRSDYNQYDTSVKIAQMICQFSSLGQLQVENIRSKAASISQKALWENFIQYYYEAYNIALTQRNLRLGKHSN